MFVLMGQCGLITMWIGTKRNAIMSQYIQHPSLWIKYYTGCIKQGTSEIPKYPDCSSAQSNSLCLYTLHCIVTRQFGYWSTIRSCFNPQKPKTFVLEKNGLILGDSGVVLFLYTQQNPIQRSPKHHSYSFILLAWQLAVDKSYARYSYDNSPTYLVCMSSYSLQ